MPDIQTRRERPRGCGHRKAGGLYLVTNGQGRGCGQIPFPLEVCPTCNQGIKQARGWTWVDSKPILDSLPTCRWASPLDELFQQSKTSPIPYLTTDMVARSPTEAQVKDHDKCPMKLPMGRVGLLWVGEKFYETPADFLKEAREMGISRKIPAVPKDFVLGEHWVWCAHRKTFEPEHEEDCAVNQYAAAFQEYGDAVVFGQDQDKVQELSEKVVQTRIDNALATASGDIKCDCEAEHRPGVFHVFKPTRIEYVVKEDDDEEKLERMENRGITLVRIEKLDDNGKPLVEIKKE